MPISNKDLGKYKRPGIFVEEIDLSIITLPIQDVLINLVPGFSKKGPFNKPVRVNTTQDFEAIYGPIDKNLENKGSFFHRTVNDMLSKGPIWALNLLATDPNRDKLQWESISVAAQYDNGPKNLSAYEYFFNRQDFWERDVESFMDIVDETYANNTSQANPAHNLLSITNMGDKKFTVFTFKSSITGFDVTAENWYGGQDKVPLFMNPKDWISDYMISILSVIGDWTDYSALSADSYWYKYFNENGLIKSKVQDFVNDRLVNINAYYDACLIPNFRDVSGRDLYVKNVINQNTDKTGLFCYYNEDALLNADFYKGNIDLIGQTMVCTDTLTDSCKKTIDFMSYKASVSEELTYTEKDLDALSNPFGNYAIDMSVAMVSGRTAQYTNWYTNIAPSGSTAAYAYNVLSTAVSAVTLTAATYSMAVDDIIYFNKSYGVIDYLTPYYITSIPSTNVITISKTKGGPVISDLTTVSSNIFIYSLKRSFSTINSGLTYILNGSEYVLNSGYTSINLFFEPFVITNSAQTGGYNRKDIVYLNTDTSGIWTVKGTQTIGTGTASKPNYLLSVENTIILGYMDIQYGLTGSTPGFTYVWNATTVNEHTGYKKLANTTDVLGLTGVTTDNINYLDLYFVGTLGSTSYSDYDKLRKTKIFTEIYTKLITNKSVIINNTNGYKFPVISPTVYLPTTTTDGHIKIYFNTAYGTDTTPTHYYNSGDFLFYYIDNEFLFPDTIPTYNLITTEKPLSAAGTGIGIVAKYSTFYQNYYDGIINNGDYVYLNNDTGSTQKIYLKMWLDSSENLTVSFSYDNVTTTSIDWTASSMIVYSDKESLKQTLEIENTSYITDFTNVTYIYVNNDRYGEIQKGYFLEAYYDETYYTEGEGYINGEYPRKLVRVTKVALDSGTTYKIIYADGPIKISSNVSGSTTDYYTTAYMSIDNYVTEYNGITLEPFVIHADSIPNGTDARLDSIMAVIDKSTNLAKGLVNKNRISWRYMIDSFGLGLTANSKQEYVDLCGAKLNCFGFINMPSARQFKTSVSPSFTNDDRTINTSYIKDGGDLTKNPVYLYSFGEGDGTSTVGYFFPYVKDVNDASKFVPPASKVAKAYMSKFTGELGASYPWQIIAGPQFSLMKDIQATEMRFTNEDLENFYSMGANPIVYTLNRGYNINSESSAQVYPVSSLSYIHSREVLIELENRLYDMLLNYHWRFNTTEIRAEIKYRADQICKELVDSDALYDFKNVCDKTNNTDYIIDLQMGVLDTYVEIIKGMGIIVNNIIILKKGTIQSGGFLLT